MYDKLNEDIKKCTAAIALNPDNAVAYYERGVAYCEKVDYNQAIADFTEAIRLKPDFVLAYIGRGRLYIRKGDDDLAKAVCLDSTKDKIVNNPAPKLRTQGPIRYGWDNGYLFSLTHESENFIVAKKDGKDVRIFYENYSKKGYDLFRAWSKPVEDRNGRPFPDYLIRFGGNVWWGVVTLARLIEQGYDFSDSDLPPMPWTNIPEIRQILNDVGYIKYTSKGET